VHQRRRGTGWRTRSGKWLSITEVLSHLQAKALRIAAREPNAPQVAVVLVDVTSVRVRRPKKARHPKAKAHKSAASRKTKAKATPPNKATSKRPKKVAQHRKRAQRSRR
jgi:hypothetical protein